MNAIVHAHLILSPAGAAALPEVLAEHRRAAGAMPGFVALRALRAPAGAEVVLELEFSSLAELQHWRNSEAHQRLGARYRQLTTCAPDARCYEVVD